MKKSAMFFVGIIMISLLCTAVLIGCGEPGDTTSPGGTNQGDDNQGGDNNQGGNNQRTEGIYVGIIKFAGNAEDLSGGAPILLNSSGKNTLINALNDDYVIAPQSGTALVYGVHKALANLKSNDAKYPANLDSVNVVTFTDGYDISSTSQSNFTSIEDKTFSSDKEYANYIKTEIANRKIAAKPVTGYSIGIRGKDVPNEYYPAFQASLQDIASAGKSKELINFSEVQSTFNAIANGLNVVHTNTNFVLVTAFLTTGTKVRMTFDVTSANPTSAEAAASAKYIEGVINLTGQTFTLTDITYTGGIASSAGAGPITGTTNGTEVNFTFNSITGYNPDSDESKTKQWLMTSDAATWRINSEYSSDGSNSSTVEKRSSIIYLVLDCSTSLETNNIAQIRTAAINFINSLYNQYDNGSSGNESDNNNGGNEEKPNETNVPNAPTGVTATAESSSSIKVTWNSVSGATKYNVYYSTSSYGTYNFDGTASTTSFTSTGWQAAQTVYFKITAENNYGESVYSSTVSATTLSSGNNGSHEEKPGETNVPNAPTGVTATAESSSSIKVTWNPVSGATKYNIYRSTSSYGTYSFDETTSTTSFTSTGWQAAQTVYFKITAENNYGESVYSSTVSATTLSSGNNGSHEEKPGETNEPPILSFNTWKNGTITAGETLTFSLTVTSGTAYYGWINDKYEGSGKTADVIVSIFNSNGDELVTAKDSAYNAPYILTPNFSGKVYIVVRGYDSYSSGTFAIACTTSSNRP